ncbi:MAG: hypothetical protein Q8M35_05030 [Pseudohongiella sp.]|nr:hypothetical protein [Pseudohongiella sp.]
MSLLQIRLQGLMTLAALTLSASVMSTVFTQTAIAQTDAAQSTTDGRAILERVEDNQRAISDAAFNRIQLSSCRFGLQNNQITCAERARVKALESVSINTGANNRDTRAI